MITKYILVFNLFILFKMFTYLKCKSFIVQLKDLMNFLFIAVFMILGVGIYYHANLFPDYQEFWSGGVTNWRIWEVLYYPYWQIYADINLDFLNGKIPFNNYYFYIRFHLSMNLSFKKSRTSQEKITNSFMSLLVPRFFH